MQDKIMKNSKKKLGMPVSDSDSCNEFYIPTGIMFIKATKSKHICIFLSNSAHIATTVFCESFSSIL